MSIDQTKAESWHRLEDVFDKEIDDTNAVAAVRVFSRALFLSVLPYQPE